MFIHTEYWEGAKNCGLKCLHLTQMAHLSWCNWNGGIAHLFRNRGSMKYGHYRLTDHFRFTASHSCQVLESIPQVDPLSQSLTTSNGFKIVIVTSIWVSSFITSSTSAFRSLVTIPCLLQQPKHLSQDEKEASARDKQGQLSHQGRIWRVHAVEPVQAGGSHRTGMKLLYSLPRWTSPLPKWSIAQKGNTEESFSIWVRMFVTTARPCHFFNLNQIWWHVKCLLGWS